MKTTTFLLILAVVIPCRADPDWEKVHRITIQGIDRLFNLDFQLAEQSFDEVIKMAPGDPRGYFFKSMIHYWVFNLTLDESAFEKFFDLSEKVIDVCSTVLKSDENNGMAKFYLGGIYGYRGLAHQRNGSLLSAVWDGRKGYGYLEEAATQNAGVYDAQMGFGLFKYLVARVPKSFRWILNILGFSGDREGGLAAIKLAADKGIYATNEAAFFYAQFSYLEEREEEAYRYLQRLLDKYPHNTLFLITYAQWEFRKNNLDNAMAAAEKAVEINNRRAIKVGDEFAFFVLGNFYFAQNDFEKAAKNMELAIRRTERREGVFNAVYYRLGLAYELLGQRAKAVETYRKTAKADREDNPWQYHNYRLARKRIVLPLDSVDITTLKATNATALKEFDRAIGLFEEIVDHPTASNDQKALALYGLSGAFLEKESLDEALRIANRLLTISPSQEQWIIPHGLLRRGIILQKLGREAEARKDFERVDDFDGYDFQDRLETRAEEEIRKLDGAS
ncbi:MAG: DUF3808 domain-containing protein [Ignavibacteriales bacterium]|nr:DUF3808 domain-containing protein [Ignavibacteriales bacterium]